MLPTYQWIICLLMLASLVLLIRTFFASERGAPALTPLMEGYASSENEARKKQLARMQVTLRTWAALRQQPLWFRALLGSPRKMLATYSAVSVLIFASCLPYSSVSYSLLALATCIATWTLVNKYVPLASSYQEKLDAQLSRYKPLDKTAFSQFQQQLLASGGVLTATLFHHWSTQEQNALDAVSLANGWAFTRRSVS